MKKSVFEISQELLMLADKEITMTNEEFQEMINILIDECHKTGLDSTELQDTLEVLRPQNNKIDLSGLRNLLE